jgi:hypothetical protein
MPKVGLEMAVSDMRALMFPPPLAMLLLPLKVPEAAQFGDIVLRQMRTHKTSALAPRGCEHISLYAMNVTKDETSPSESQVQRVEVRSHSVTPRDTIQLFLQATDRVLHDADHYDQLREIFSTITLTKSAHQVGEVGGGGGQSAIACVVSPPFHPTTFALL